MGIEAVSALSDTVAMQTARGSADDNFPDLFRGYIARSAGAILASVKAEGVDLSVETRERALHVLSFALGACDLWPTISALLLAMAPSMERGGFRGKWLTILQDGIVQARSIGDDAAEGALAMHAGLLQQLLGNFAEAERAYRNAHDLFAVLDESQEVARALNRRGYIARLERRFDDASNHLCMAGSLLAETGTERGYNEFALGGVALDEREFVEAIAHFRRSLSLWQQSGQQRQIAWGYRNLGAALFLQKEYNGAVACTKEAIGILEEIGDSAQAAVAQMNLGAIFVDLGQTTDAIRAYVQAEITLRRMHDTLHLAMLYNNFGYAYKKEKEWALAHEAYAKSVACWGQIGDVAALVNVLDGIGMAYLDEGRLACAVLTFEDAIARIRSIKHEPSYQHSFDMVHRHLAETKERLVRPKIDETRETLQIRASRIRGN